MTHHDPAHGKDKGLSRRHALECMSGQAPAFSGRCRAACRVAPLGSAQAAESGFTFLQISDSHVGFDKPANPNALGTLQEAIAKVARMPAKPAFMIHTGDITHLSKPKQFDDADQVIGRAKLDVHYVPGRA